MILESSRITVISGHYGSGKTEFAVNYAFFEASRLSGVTLVDLDIVNPYFCSREREYQLSQAGVKPTRTEGHNGSNWIVIDYSDIIVHVFYKETRDFYQLERLWADGEHVDIDELIK